METNYWQNIKKRYYFIQVVLLIFLSVFIFRSYQLFFFSPIPPIERNSPNAVKRGIIFDSHENELAISREKISIAVKPKEIIDVDQTAFLLSNITSIPENDIVNILKREDNFIWLKHKASSQEADDIQKLKIPGIIFEKEHERFYPNHHLASSLLGFVGFSHEGLEGLEYQFNEILTQKNPDSYSGLNLHLTIDAYIQHKLEQSLNSALIKTKGSKAVGIISEVKTGKILAMASLPNYNSNDPFSGGQKQYKNYAITETYEPGSTFKIFILAALLNELKVNEKKKYFCPGYFEHKGDRVRCSGKHGWQNLRQAFKNSCNSVIIQASWVLPVYNLYENLLKFGFDSKTGINLPGESKGNLPHPKNWGKFLKMTIPIGHGLSLTPIQLIKGANVIGNSGEMINPYIVDKTTSPNGKTVEEFRPGRGIKVISKSDADAILDYLRGVVQKGGTGEAAALGELVISGKTGTSMKSDNKGYTDKVQASFLGYFPGDNPEISILIWVDEPEGDLRQGGKVAAPVFKEVLNEIIALVHKGESYKISPLKNLPYDDLKFNTSHMPNLIGKSKKEVIFILKNQFRGSHKLSGSGYVIEQNPPKGSKIKPPFEFTVKFSW
ncbi:MAG: transpeptidase family protein [Spirochaetia bacterium]|nr:transpeptidase family protein [Spirochaetia bacterium]